MFMKVLLICLSCLFACSQAEAQLANPDFENWYDDNGQTRLTGWEHLVKNDLNNISMVGTWQTTTSQHDSYALVLSRWYNYTWDVVRQRAPITGHPMELTGYYQYTENALIGGIHALDTAAVDVYITRWNSSLLQEDTIGYGRTELGYSGGYSPFNCTINYMQALQPDSILIHIEPSKWAGVSGNCADSNYCSFLTIDNLSLINATAVPQTATPSISVFPVPVTDRITLRNLGEAFDLSIVDMTGRVLYTAAPAITETSIDVSLWPAGVYLLQLRDSNGGSSVYKVVKE
jgi:hypothetical protein